MIKKKKGENKEKEFSEIHFCYNCMHYSSKEELCMDKTIKKEPTTRGCIHLKEKSAFSLKEIKERLKLDEKIGSQYIFDEDKITTKQHFALGQFKGKNYFGVMIPKEEKLEVKDKKKGDFSKTIQKPVQIIVLEDHTFYEITPQFEEEHNVKFSEILLLERGRWNLAEIKDFILHQKALKNLYKIDGFKLFQKIKKLYEKYIYVDEDFYDLHAIWDMGTYFFDQFDAFPYIELNGLAGTGKTKLMKISSLIAFNGQMFVKPTPATLFRFVERNKPTIYMDEVEKLFRGGNKISDTDDVVELLNAGYAKGGFVPRAEKNSLGEFKIRCFDVYCPKVLAGISGLRGALQDRCITEIMVKPPKGDHRGDLEVRDNEEFGEIRNKLYGFALKSNIEKQYNNMPRDFHLTNRDWQLWRPLLAVALIIDKNVYQKLGELAEKLTLLKEEVLEEDSWDFKIIEALKDIVNNCSGFGDVSINGIRENLNFGDGERKPNNHYIGRYLNKIGFKKYKRRIAAGVFYRLNAQIVETVLVNQNIITQTTLITQTTSEEEVIDDKQKITKPEQEKLEV